MSGQVSRGSVGEYQVDERAGFARLRRLEDSMHMSLSNLWEMVKDKEAWHAAVHGVAKSWVRLSIVYWNASLRFT